MGDPAEIAAEAASKIVAKLAERGLLPADGVSRRIIEPFVAAEIVVAITRSVCAPSHGLGK